MSTTLNANGRKAFLVGGGIASLSAAVFLIRDGGMPGKNITIFEALDIAGGSLDGAGGAEKGYVLRVAESMPAMMKTMNCIPCMMPYITSMFLTRSKGDRPLVIPEGSTNLAFLGQFTEIPDDVVFTVEYSVRSAQMAVYGLLGIDNKVPAMYKGYHNPKVIYDAMKTMHR
jgi:myosin-crossreactive antigen